MKKTAKKWITGLLSVLCLGAVGFGVGSLHNAVNASAVTYATSEITMQEGAQARKVGEAALRFTANISDETKTRIDNGEVTAGMIILPYSYMDRYYAQTEYTDYCEYFEKKGAPHFKFTYTGEHIQGAAGGYYIRGAVDDIQFLNLDRRFLAIAYIDDGTTKTYAPYTDGTNTYVDFDANARSVAYVASGAITFSDDTDGTGALIRCLNKTAYKEYGVTYDKATGKYVYGENSYTYDELLTAVDIGTVKESVYALPDWDFDCLFADETYSLQTSALADLKVKYTSSNELIGIGETSGLISVPAGAAGQSATITATVGNDTVDFFEYTATVPTIKEASYPTIEAMQTGVTFDWNTTYMAIGNQNGYRAKRTLLSKLDTEVQTSLSSHSSGVVMHLTDGTNWLYGLTKSDGNLIPGYADTDNDGVNDVRNVYTFEFWYYGMKDTNAYVIAMDDSGSNRTIRALDFKEGLHKVTFEYEGIEEGTQFVLNLYSGTETLDIYMGDMTVTCEQRAIERTDYYAPTDEEMLAEGGYAWDFLDGNLLELSGNASYVYLSGMTDDTDLRYKLINQTRAFGNYALRLSQATGAGSYISFLTDKLATGYIYEIGFDAYQATAGHPVIIPYDTTNGQEDRSHLEYQISDNGDGTWHYETWIEATGEFNALMLYPISATDLYISRFNIKMVEPMTKETATGTITPEMMSALNQGELVATPTNASGQTGFGDTAYMLDDRTINGTTDDVTLDLYKFDLANNARRFESITVTVYYYVEETTADRVFVSHDGHDKSGKTLDLSTEGYKTATFTWGYNVGLLDLVYLGVRKDGGTFGTFYIGSIEYTIDSFVEAEVETVSDISYALQVSTDKIANSAASTTSSTVVTENAAVTAVSLARSASAATALSVETKSDAYAGVWIEVPSAYYTAGERVRVAFTLTPSGTGKYAPVRLYDDSGNCLDYAYPSGAASKANYDTTVVEKNGRDYVYIGLRNTVGYACVVSDITIDRDLTPTGESLFGGSKLIQLNNQAQSQMQGYLMKTWDGELIVIDGGTHNETALLAAQIRENVTPDGNGKYRVNAWFLTHFHNDHVWALLNLLNDSNYDDIVIEELYYDFEGAEAAHTAGYKEANDEYVSILQPLLKAINAAKYSGQIEDTRISGVDTADTVTSTTTTITATGALYTTSGGAVTIKALNRAKFDCDGNYINNSSVVYKIETETESGEATESVLMLGDLGNYGDTLITDAYFLGEMKTCRVIQMAHHGQAGTSENFYAQIEDIRICLYPAPNWLYDNFSADLWQSTGEIGSASYGTLETRAWMRERGVRYSYSMADGILTLG